MTYTGIFYNFNSTKNPDYEKPFIPSPLPAGYHSILQ
jgi:hypothetical protein